MAAGDWKDMLVAIEQNNLDLVKYHILQGVNPNYQHPEYFTTPLVEAIRSEHYDIVKYLLENGADPLLKVGFSSDNPLSVARTTKNQEIITLIQSYLPSEPTFFKSIRYKIGSIFKAIFG